MSDTILSVFKPGEVMSYFEYVDRVLYTSALGYYAQLDKKRVGYERGSDFYTSMNVSDGLFGRLMVSAMERLLTDDFKSVVGAGGVSTEKDKVCLVELGAEPGNSVIDLDVAKIFGKRKVVRLGETFVAEEDEFTILFANELLDAQPFQRFRFEDGVWCELGVRVEENGVLKEVVLSGREIDESMEKYLRRCSRLKEDEIGLVVRRVKVKMKERLSCVKAESGYVLDYPSGAGLMLEGLVAGGWKGMVVLCDYGHSWKRLSEECGQGTGRGYKEHRMIGDVLQYPTQMDITSHICWDFCREILEEGGFTAVGLESQEKFLVQYADRAIQGILEKSTGAFSKERQGVMQLIHPGHMGQKFQMMWGVRK
jgi:SAM-dependent MidA family methyltransferase